MYHIINTKYNIIFRYNQLIFSYLVFISTHSVQQTDFYTFVDLKHHPLKLVFIIFYFFSRVNLFRLYYDGIILKYFLKSSL